MTPRSLAPHAVVALVVAVFLGVGAVGIGRFPRVYEDEPWIAAPGYSLFTTGVFGVPFDPGFFGIDRHCFGFMPLVPIAVGAAMRVFGLGLLQARLVPLLAAALVLVLTHLLASRLLSPWHGAVACSLLALAPVAAPAGHLPTGIPLVDLARIARYDIAVPVFGLAAFLTLVPVLTAQRKPAPSRFMIAGVLVGLAALSHLYGAIFLPALLAGLLAAKVPRASRTFAWCVGGFFLALAPWIVFVAAGWPDYVGQNLNAADRFRLLDPAFYAGNLRGELARYGLVLAAAASRFSPWLFVLSLGAGVAVLVRRGPRALLAAPAVLVFSFALLLKSKNVLYLAPLWPFAAIIAAAGIVAAWKRLARAGRILLALALLGAGLEGTRSLAAAAAAAGETTDYAALTRALGERIPAGSRVVGMQHWWLGLAGRFPSYATVPTHHTLARFTDHPVSFQTAMDQLAPDVFIVDPILRDFLRPRESEEPELRALGRSIEDWVAGHGRRIATLVDPSYGTFELYAVSRGPASGARDPIRASEVSRTSSTDTRARHRTSPREHVGCMQAPHSRSSL